MQQLLDFINTMPETVKNQTIKKFIAPGESIVVKGCDVVHLYILINGIANVSNEFADGHRYTFAQFGPPSLIGEVEVLAEQPVYAATVQAVTFCTILSMDIAAFWHWITGNASLSLLIAQLVSQKMYPTSNNNGIIKFMSSRQKIIFYLFEQYIQQDKDYFLLSKNHQQIADEIGTSVKTVNRCLNWLKAENIISIIHGKITIASTQIERLRNFIDFYS